MLSKKNRINKDLFPNLIKNAQNFSSENMYMKLVSGFSPQKAFAFIVSLKVSKSAVKRNKIKRMARGITHAILKDVVGGTLVAVFFKPTIVGKKYTEIKNEMISLYKKAKIV